MGRVNELLIERFLDMKKEEGQILVSVACGDLKRVEGILNEDPMLIKATTEGGLTPLLRAVQSGDREMTELLVTSGAHPDEKDCHGCTSLHKAVFLDHLEIAELLISKGANINAKDCYGNTALSLASRDGLLEIATLLIKKGADVNFQDNKLGVSPLHLAIIEGHRSLVKLLLKKGANVKAKSAEGHTPLEIARIFRRKEIYELIKHHGLRGVNKIDS